MVVIIFVVAAFDVFVGVTIVIVVVPVVAVVLFCCCHWLVDVFVVGTQILS